MAAFAVSNPVEYYKYAMNDADIVVSFCSELFQCNHAGTDDVIQRCSFSLCTPA